ncbi:hypothetical protein [Parachryseolinea silvisoli]|uniref:hypothetical protein n=1 Tax=Parachryseolinea silvisoli TaxID=2873601 RepID=UPI002265CC4E|nr:hypothetical protein [Parachryseolinea silvisoli]MCD9019220.1 hypothetical protein [Parachryseolinea silvisoli]
MRIKHLSILKCAVVIGGVVLLHGCNGDDDTPNPATTSPCIITSAPSYFGTTQTFEYNQSGELTTRKYEFGYPGYGPFTQTVDRDKTHYAYTHSGNLVEITNHFQGGTGNFYDGQPEWMVRDEHQEYGDGRPDYNSTADTLLSFGYDDKKRLNVITYHHDLIGGSVQEIYSRQLYHTVLELTYDANDNVTHLKQYLLFREGVYNVNVPSESYFVYKQDVQTEIDVTYDDKPSPYSVMSKYWKFVQEDWGYVINSNWQAIIISLSENNPVTIHFSLFRGNEADTNTSPTYDYNEQGFPIGGYTYDCR